MYIHRDKQVDFFLLLKILRKRVVGVEKHTLDGEVENKQTVNIL